MWLPSRQHVDQLSVPTVCILSEDDKCRSCRLTTAPSIEDPQMFRSLCILYGSVNHFQQVPFTTNEVKRTDCSHNLPVCVPLPFRSSIAAPALRPEEHTHLAEQEHRLA